jgi:hypothetical protein
MKVELNAHGLYEIKLNLSDAVLKGTGDHLAKMSEVISRYMLLLDK